MSLILPLHITEVSEVRINKLVETQAAFQLRRQQTKFWDEIEILPNSDCFCPHGSYKYVAPVVSRAIITRLVAITHNLRPAAF